MDKLDFCRYDHLYYYFIKAKNREISGEVVVPPTHNGLPVMRVGDFAFAKCRNITSVTLPEGIDNIGEAAFFDCQGLESINIPDSVCTIGEAAFCTCIKLKSIVLSECVTDIKARTFADCKQLTSIKLGDYVTDIGESAFFCCHNLPTITIPNGVRTIGKGAISLCTSLKNIVYCGTIEEWNAIDKHPDWDGSSAKDYVINCTDGSIKKNGEVFKNLKYYWIDDDRKDLTVGGKGQVTDTDIVIPATYRDYPVKEINRKAFMNEDITTAVLPDSIETINDFAFRACASLTKLTLGSGLTRIGNLSLGDCTALKEIVYNGTTDEWSAVSKGVGWYPRNTQFVVTCTDGYVTAIGVAYKNFKYKLSADGKYYIVDGMGAVTDNDIFIPNEHKGLPVKAIAAFAFNDCENLTAVNIAEGITEIGNYAFCDCTNVIKMELPSTLTTIGNSAFSKCKTMSDIEIPPSVTSIGENAFYYCENMVSATIPNGITTINADTFYGCKNLTSVTIPNTVTSIKPSAFCHCSSLKEITLPSRITQIEKDVFECCSSLSSITFPSGVTVIGEGAFSGCHALTSIVIPDSVVTIAKEAFNWCSNLMSVTLGKGLQTLGDRAFNTCSKLIEIVNYSKMHFEKESYGYQGIAENAKYIVSSASEKGKIFTTDDGFVFYENGGDGYLMAYNGSNSVVTVPQNKSWKSYTVFKYAFEKNASVTKLIFPEGVTAIMYGALDNCEKLTSVTLPRSLTRLDYIVFDFCDNLKEVIYNGPSSRFYGTPDIEKLWDRRWEYSITCDDAIITQSTVPHSLDKNYNYTKEVLAYSFSSAQGSYAVFGVGSITAEDIVIPDTFDGLPVKEMRSPTFYNCQQMKTLSIGKNVTTITSGSMHYCTNLTTLTISKNLTAIEMYALANCTSLSKIVYDGTIAQFNAIKRAYSWDEKTNDYVVVCADGTIRKDQIDRTNED